MSGKHSKIASALAVGLALLLSSACTQNPTRQGMNLIDEGKFEEAITLLKPLAEQTPDDWGVQQALGDAYFNRALQLWGEGEKIPQSKPLMDAFENAKNYYKRAYDIHSDTWLMTRMGRIADALSNVDVPDFHFRIREMKQKGWIKAAK